jgi:hypothetical protein
VADLIELSADFELDRYNSLFSVEYANAAVRNDNAISHFLADAAVLFVSHGMQSLFGVALLHRHHTLRDGERMIQYGESFGDEPALVTRPVVGPDQESAVPWVWTLQDGQLHPMEFTTDPLARSLFTQGRQLPEAFVADFAELIDRSPVGHLIGLAIVERGFYNSATDDCGPIEYTADQTRSNVIFIRERSSFESHSIETTWAFEGDVDPVLGCYASTSCGTSCYAYCKSRCGENKDLEHYRIHEGARHEPHHNKEPEHTWDGTGPTKASAMP